MTSRDELLRQIDLLGTTFDLFHWEGAMVTGTFQDIVTAEEVEWDTSDPYTSGAVTPSLSIPAVGHTDYCADPIANAYIFAVRNLAEIEVVLPRGLCEALTPGYSSRRASPS